MDTLRLAVTASLVAGTAVSALAADVLVPQDVPNLKDALLSAQPGDRVIVTGGVWRNGRVVSDIDLVGRSGATLSGLWEIQGAGATVEGFAVRDGSIEIETDGVTLRRNRFSAPTYTPMLTGTGTAGTTLEDNRFSSATAQFDDSTDLLARGNRFAVGELIVYGNGTTADANVFVRNAQLGVHNGSGAVVTNNQSGQIYVTETPDATVTGNRIRGGALYVEGHGALVADNVIPAGRNLVVDGDDAVVHGNRLSSVAPSGVFIVRGARAVVTDNVVDNLRAQRVRMGTSALMWVRSEAPATVLRNRVSHEKSGGLAVYGDGIEIASNTVLGTSAAGSMRIEGDLNNVHDNEVVRKAEIDDTMSGIVVTGAENVLADVSLSGAPYDGVVVSGAGNLLARVRVGRAGRCGITVAETSTSTGVADCVVDSARWASLYVLGTDTTVTGGSFTGGRKVDVLDLGTNTQFVSSTFVTKSEDEALQPYR